MKTAVYLSIHADTYARFAHIRTQLLQGNKESQANALGNVLSEMACEVIEQVFMVLLQENQQHSKTGESEKVIQQILEAIRKYMPWSVSFLEMTVSFHWLNTYPKRCKSKMIIFT